MREANIAGSTLNTNDVLRTISNPAALTGLTFGAKLVQHLLKFFAFSFIFLPILARTCIAG
jgi:hypothetical protein